MKITECPIIISINRRSIGKEAPMQLVKKILQTQAGVSVSLLRFVLGFIFFKEGAGKIFGWFGGGGFVSTCAYFQKLGIPFPEFNAYFVGYTEFLGGIALLAGLLTRLAAFPIAMTMITAILTAHKTGGYNYPLLILACCLVLMRLGGGKISVDRFLNRP